MKGIFVVILLYLIHHFCHHQTEGFQLLKIHSDLPPSPQWELPAPSSEALEHLHTLLSQPFSYLDSGGQCYAFLSQDRSVVLKFFKMHHLRQYLWLQKRSLPGIFDRLRVQFLLLQKQKLQRVFVSSKIAYTQLKEETGLLHLNLNPSPSLRSVRIQLIDKLGITHLVSLENIPFALQYRADNVFKRLRFHLAQRDIPSAKEVIDHLLQCLNARYEKGIQDHDPALRRNIGLLKERAIFIDIGSFYTAESPPSVQERAGDTRRMRKWLHKRSPELTQYFDSVSDTKRQ